MTSLKRWWLLAILLLNQSAPAATNPFWTVQVWQVSNGLPNNGVLGLTQMPDQYLWAAGPRQFVRFDGVSFEEFPLDQLGKDLGTRIRLPVWNDKGGLWLVMDPRRVAYVNPPAAPVVLDGLPAGAPLVALEDGEGALWITFRGGAVCRIRGRQIKRFTVQDGLPEGTSICGLACDNQGRIWFAKEEQFGRFYDGRFHALLQLPSPNTRLAKASNGGVWISSFNQLFLYDEQHGLKACGAVTQENLDVRPTVLIEDHSGAVWIGTSSTGLFYYDGGGFKSVPTSDNNILSLAEDHEGNIWVGTFAGAINRVQKRAIVVEGSQTGLAFEAVQSICEDTHGVIWAAAQNGLLLSRTGTDWNTVPLKAASDGRVACVASDARGAVWIGTSLYELHCLKDGRLTTWGKAEGIEGHTVRALLPTRNGEVWIGSEGPEALQCLREGKFHSFKLPVRPSVRVHVRTMVEDAAGTVWFGAGKGLLLRADKDELVDESAKTAPDQTISCFYPSPDGSLWMGYIEGGGLGVLKNGHLTRIGTEQGLYDDHISQMVADGQGCLWFGSTKGLFKVGQKELEDVVEGRSARVRSVAYGGRDGLPHMQTNFAYSLGALRGGDGRLWIPMGPALAVIQPEKLHDNLEAPRVIVKKVMADDETIAAYGGITSPAAAIDLRSQPVKLKLLPDHHRLEFDFTALSFSAPENVRFSYRLVGFDDQWIDAGTQRSASYSRLPAGDYSFRVKACNSDGVWNETGAVVYFSVAPFFWQTWWFRLVGLAVFTSVIVLIVRYVSFRRLHLKVRLLKQQAALDKERARIARDIHDDLGGRLTKIVLLSGLALRERAAPEQTEVRVQEIAVTARQVIKSLDETVWAINPRNDTLPDLINYLGQFAVEFLRTAEIRCHVEMPDHPPGRAISAEARHNLFLATKEALNNIVRHAGACEVWLRVNVTLDSLNLTIEDCGQGFARLPDDAGADGIRNMRQRMDEIGGEFHIEGKPGMGTKVSFIYRWPHVGE
ncbi:MAG TPA: two-component regulator propeller domain-containing protein [Opitutaceae bacterium]|nr:two-component regulator propeller domain-containing protein [Opitutaceae bacterium]